MTFDEGVVPHRVVGVAGHLEFMKKHPAHSTNFRSCYYLFLPNGSHNRKANGAVVEARGARGFRARFAREPPVRAAVRARMVPLGTHLGVQENPVPVFARDAVAERHVLAEEPLVRPPRPLARGAPVVAVAAPAQRGDLVDAHAPEGRLHAQRRPGVVDADGEVADGLPPVGDRGEVAARGVPAEAVLFRAEGDRVVVRLSGAKKE